MAGILLVLGGMHARIVRHGADHAGVHADVRSRIQRIGRHVEADVLHGTEAAGAAGGRAERHLKGHLFIGGPFAINVVAILDDVFRDFGAGSAGIGGHDGDAGLIQPAGNGFVAQHEGFLHGCTVLSGEGKPQRAGMRAYTTYYTGTGYKSKGKPAIGSPLPPPCE